MEATQFNVTAEMVYRTDEDIAHEVGDNILTELSGYSPVLSESVGRRQLITITLPAPDLKTATTTAMSIISGVAGEIVSIQGMHTSDYDESAGAILQPGDFLTVGEAAEKLGTSGQNIRARIKRGSIPASRLGSQWIIPTEAIPAPTLSSVAAGIRRELPEAHVNQISDTGLEIYLGDDFYLIEQNQDEAWGDGTDWSGREGWIDATDGTTQHTSEVAITFDGLREAAEAAVAYLSSKKSA